MKFGIDVINAGHFADPKHAVELAQAAEASGWDGFFIWDHLKGPLAELVIAAVTLGVRCIVFIALYVISGIFSVIFIVVGYIAGYTAHVIQEELHLFCLDACHAARGEIACIILC